MIKYFIILIVILISCSLLLHASMTDKNASSFEILTNLKNWGSLMLSPVEESNLKKYVALEVKSLRFISPYAKEYRDLSKNEIGKTLTENALQYKIYIYFADGKDVWNNTPSKYYIGAVRISDNWEYLVFDCKEVYHAKPVNPKLSENLTSYDIPWKDTSDCPLKIMAYQIELKGGEGSSAGLVVQNSVNKEIIRVQGTVELLDRKNKPVPCEGGSNRFSINRPVTISAFSPCLALDFWATEKNIDFRFVKPAITEIQFSDGTIWGKQ